MADLASLPRNSFDADTERTLRPQRTSRVVGGSKTSSSSTGIIVAAVGIFVVVGVVIGFVIAGSGEDGEPASAAPELQSLAGSQNSPAAGTEVAGCPLTADLVKGFTEGTSLSTCPNLLHTGASCVIECIEGYSTQMPGEHRTIICANPPTGLVGWRDPQCVKDEEALDATAKSRLGWNSVNRQLFDRRAMMQGPAHV